MAEYKLKDGHVLTDDDFEALAKRAEVGDYPGTPGTWIVRPQGRPSLSDEDLVTIAFKIPRSQREVLDQKAASRNETRSQFLREMLGKALAAG